LNFRDTGKEIGFCGRPETKVAPNLSLGDICALAWARSNFPAEGGPDILEANCEGTKISVLLAEDQEYVTFQFKTELGAARAFKELPAATGLTCPFTIAADDLAALEAAMNFGQIAPPAPEVAYEFAPA
jgi:hypothetical protein